MKNKCGVKFGEGENSCRPGKKLEASIYLRKAHFGGTSTRYTTLPTNVRSRFDHSGKELLEFWL